MSRAIGTRVVTRAFDPRAVRGRHTAFKTHGAALHPDLAVPDDVVMVTKGTRFDKDQCSAFDETGLDQRLHRDGVQSLIVAGLALDVCVRETALDARRLGFGVTVIAGACRAVDQNRAQRVLEELEGAGVVIDRTDFVRSETL